MGPESEPSHSLVDLPLPVEAQEIVGEGFAVDQALQRAVHEAGVAKILETFDGIGIPNDRNVGTTPKTQVMRSMMTRGNKSLKSSTSREERGIG